MADAPLRIDRPGPLAPFTLASGRGRAHWQTRVSVDWDDATLRVEALCEDADAWGTHRHRDAPLWEEEAFEVFLSPGEADPRRYFELEVSPLGSLFDAEVRNPTGLRRDLFADTGWNCAGLRWTVERTGQRQDWRVELAIPWAGLLGGAARPSRWRLNFYRIERPQCGPAELSCWSPTLTDPPDFHRPERFGLLDLGETPARSCRGADPRSTPRRSGEASY